MKKLIAYPTFKDVDFEPLYFMKSNCTHKNATFKVLLRELNAFFL